MSRAASLAAARARVAALQGRGAFARAALPFGDPGLDGAFPAGGLPLGCWHEVAGTGMETETAAAPGAFAAALASPLARRGAVVWVMRRDDLHAPGLAGLGFPAHRLIQVKAPDEAQALAAMEDALASAGVAAVIGEAAAPDLTAGRRLQLACERRGATGFLIRRRPFGAPAGAGGRAGGGGSGSGSGPGSASGSAAATRWAVAAAPSQSPRLANGLEAPGLGPTRWRIDLNHCRGGRPGSWIVELSDGAYPLRVVARMGDRELETSPPRRRAG
jgi:protein ImuA